MVTTPLAREKGKDLNAIREFWADNPEFRTFCYVGMVLVAIGIAFAVMSESPEAPPEELRQGQAM
jgi:hypothetical protein